MATENTTLATGYGSIEDNLTSRRPEPEIEDFITKYGQIEVEYITPPSHNPWFTKPYALNYFHHGTLYRTRHERTSGKLELFLDLVYVGIVANLAASAVERHDWYGIVKYIVVFLPAFTVWSDIKEMMNYYFNDDLLQRAFVVWEVVLLLVYNNNVLFVDDKNVGEKALFVAVLSYALARGAYALILLFYARFISEHNLQMKLFSAGLVCTCSLWFVILLPWSLPHRAIYAIGMFVLEQTIFCLSVHPTIKRKLKLEYSTALNIEHEDERYHAFFIMAIGEFLYGLCAGSPLALSFNPNLYKGIIITLISFVFLGLYSSKDGTRKAVHSMRRSGASAMVFIYAHLVLIGSLLIVGDAGADLAKGKHEYLPEDERGVLFYFHGGLMLSLLALTAIAYADKDLDTDRLGGKYARYLRTGFRFPVAVLLLLLSWSNYRVLTILEIDFGLLGGLWWYEFVLNTWD